MSISHLFPEEGPTLNLNFAGSRTLDPRITFTRTSIGTYMGSDGLIKVAPADSPRFDHRYVNGEIESLGLLVEEQRSNSIRYSTIVGTVGTKPTGFEFASSIVGQSCEVSTDFDIDGNGNCIKHIRGESGDSNVGYPTSAGTLVSGITYTFSVYVYIPLSQKNNITSIRFGPDNGFSSVTFGYADLNITDRWQRVIGSFVSNGGGGVLCRATASNGAFFYTDAWQFEEGTYPTSYIPTVASTVTRNQDRVLIDGERFLDWYNPDEGTFFCNVNSPRGTVVFGVGDTFDNTIYTTAGGSFSGAIRSGGTATSLSGTISSSGISKIAFGVKTDNSALCINGQITGTSLTADMPINPVRLTLGASPWSPTAFDNQVDGTISQLTYYPTRLTNTQLQTLTK